MKYNYKQTLMKMGIITIEVFVSGLIVYLTDVKAALFLIPILEGARNYFKNRNN